MSKKLAGYNVIVLEDMSDNLMAILPPPRLVSVATDRETGKKVCTWEFKPTVLLVDTLLQQYNKT